MARVVFFGTPEFAASTLQAVHDAGHTVVLVVTQVDKRRGRSSRVSPSPVKAVAQQLGLPVSSRVRDVLDVEADVGVLVAFGRIIRSEILQHLPIINLHPSLLPRWRGATPVEAAIMAGDEQTGICLMQLVEEMDAGPIYSSCQTTIGSTERASDLYERLFLQGNKMLMELLSHELPTPVPQQGEVTYCGKLSAEDFHIDWTMPASHIQRLTRIGRPWTTFRDRRVLVLSAEESQQRTIGSPGQLHGTDVQTGDGTLTLVTVQPEAKAAMDARAWTNGLRLDDHETFQ